MQEQVDETIKVNHGYKLVGVMNEQPHKLCFVSGRQGNTVTLLLVSGIATAQIQHYDHDFARVNLPDGAYNLMPCNKVTDLDEVAEICAIIRSSL